MRGWHVVASVLAVCTRCFRDGRHS